MATIRRVVLVGSLVLGAVTFVGPAPAGAHTDYHHFADDCLDFFHVSSIGSITHNPGTCDGADNWYVGRVRDDHATSDGSCVRAVLQEIVMAVSCTSGGAGFSYQDPQPRDNSALTCMTETNSGDASCTYNRGF
jgi:hypothetical protein